MRDETPDVRGILVDLLTMAGDGRYSQDGEIKLTNKGIGYTDKQISEILHIKLSAWRRVKRRLLDTDRIKISQKGAISIVNWSKYQSEYSRQKPYRQHQKAKEIDPTKYTSGKYGDLVKR